jgi:hypothetical protein
VSSGESNFSYSLIFVLLSNLLFNFRNVASKNILNSPLLQDPTALFYLINIIGSFIGLPFMLLELTNTSLLFGDLWSAGFYHFMYNWCSFLLLSRLPVLSHAIGNVMKRAFVIIFAIIFYNSPLLPTTAIGVALSIGGSILYTYITAKRDSQPTTEATSRLVRWFVVLSICMLLVPYLPSKQPPSESETGENWLPIHSDEKLPTQEYNKFGFNLPHFVLFWTRAEHSFPPRLEKSIESILYHHKNATVTLYASYLDEKVPLANLSREYPNQIIVERIDVLYDKSSVNHH